MYIGESEGKLHRIFEKARSSRPAVIFFDEIEALGAKRSGHHSNQHEVRLVSQFLAEMDGFSKSNAGVLVLGATNLPWAVDAAFRRPGRFDRFLFVPPPDRAGREAVLRIHLRGRPVDPKLDVARLAAKTGGFSGADLEGLVDSAADGAIAAALDGKPERAISMKDFDEALEDLKPTTLEWLTTARNYARYSNEGGQYDEVLAFLREHGRD
jgi:transitional endoplasmic reticulum ATPase